MQHQLAQLPGIQPMPSAANFLLIRSDQSLVPLREPWLVRLLAAWLVPGQQVEARRQQYKMQVLLWVLERSSGRCRCHRGAAPRHHIRRICVKCSFILSV